MVKKIDSDTIIAHIDSPLMEKIDSAIEKNRKNFILHNIVRLREMIRYLPTEKLTLFKEIPFLIHVNRADFPGYVKSAETSFGVWNFENSGFARDISERRPAARELLMEGCHNPAVQAIYHIGSLGTFTQSTKSDFDFWVVIDKSDFNDERLNSLHEKLALITTYSRKSFSQEVTFFVHYAHNLRENSFNNPDDDETVAVPELLLKEEFYRTFIMVAGKIPLWAVQPLDLEPHKIDAWKKMALEYGGFIDLGTLDSMPLEEVQLGLLWQICKSPYDPVKSVIKASITASYCVKEIKYRADPLTKDSNSSDIEEKENLDEKREDTKIRKKPPLLLCDRVKERFGESIIDDYAADPYIIAFERIIEFYTELGDPRALSQIKAAIFFRLCGFPLVSLPAKDSPKRKILERYIRRWQLGSTRLKKLLEYQQWPEAEKTLFDQTMVERLSSLYRLSLEEQSGEQSASPSPGSKREMDLKILKNRVNKITVKKRGALPTCSTYLRLKPQKELTLIEKSRGQKSDNMDQQEKLVQEWLLFSKADNGLQDKRYNLLYTTGYFLKTLGWSMYNHIYIRGRTKLDIRSPLKLYKSFDKEADCDDIYLALQPWMPLSDDPFLFEPCWEKIVILITSENREEARINMENSSPDRATNSGQPINMPQQAEFLIRDSWGEIFFEALYFGPIDPLEKRCYKTAMKIVEYHKENSHYEIFQIASTPVPKLIQQIKTIVEDTRARRDNYAIRRGPYLDTI